ncbi:MAG: flagellar M-ring protein FliF [Thermoleophilia bacterium]|nr:flagellar M-ring protein FliF [Thermoleophilia bacterium]
MGGLSRVGGFWNGLGGPSRRLLIAGVLIAGVGLFLLFRLSGSAAWANLASGMTPEDAAAVTQKLQSLGVKYQLTEGGGTVQVPADKVDQARLDLAQSNLLGGGGGVGFEIFDRQSLGATDFTQKVNLVRAMEGELARTIARVEPVEAATVNIAMPQERLFTSEQQPVTASVLLNLRTGATLDAGQVKGVTNLVAMSVPGLKPANITITDEKGNILSGTGADTAVAGANSRMAIEASYERTVQSRLDAMLATIVGPGLAVAQVDADLDLNRVQRDSETYNPRSVTPLQREESNEQMQSQGGAAAGTAGATANTPGAYPAAAGSQGDTRYKKTTTNVRNGVDRVRETITEAPGTVTRQSISVQVSDKVDAAMIPKIQNAVQAAVGFNPQRDEISVQSMTFAQTDPSAAPAGAGASATKAGEAPAAGMDVIGMAKTGGVILGVLLMLFLVSRSLKRRQRGIEGRLPELLAHGPVPVAELGAATAGTPEERRRLEIERKSSLQEQMEDLATNRPEDVAQLLRGWLVEGKH